MAAAFTPRQLDAIAELLNLGCGRAARALNELSGIPVALSAPVVVTLPRDRLGLELERVSGDRVIAIEQQATGIFNALSLLVFSDSAKPVLARALASGLYDPTEIPDATEEMLIELGNMLLNAVFSALTDLFRIRLDTSLPVFIETTATELDQRFVNAGDEVLVAEVLCALPEIRVSGMLLLVLAVESLHDFHAAVAALAAE